ncbi:AMP-binding protein, partial [Streptomyces sp. NPDC059853]|uniref:AMP-binding protein n=1 Tax=Streptomyces sp. NPDC059853 TaxID=3346973 RepID=UPI0036492DC2
MAATYVPIPGLTAEDRVPWPLPLFHSLAHIFCVLAVTSAGATAHLLDGFTGDEVLDATAEHRATLLVGVPTLYHQLTEAARRRGTARPAPTLRTALVGGSVTPRPRPAAPTPSAGPPTPAPPLRPAGHSRAERRRGGCSEVVKVDSRPLTR